MGEDKAFCIQWLERHGSKEVYTRAEDVRLHRNGKDDNGEALLRGREDGQWIYYAFTPNAKPVTQRWAETNEGIRMADLIINAECAYGTDWLDGEGYIAETYPQFDTGWIPEIETRALDTFVPFRNVGRNLTFATAYCEEDSDISNPRPKGKYDGRIIVDTPKGTYLLLDWICYKADGIRPFSTWSNPFTRQEKVWWRNLNNYFAKYVGFTGGWIPAVTPVKRRSIYEERAAELGAQGDRHDS